jgi:hypothetical protein
MSRCMIEMQVPDIAGLELSMMELNSLTEVGMH